MAVAGNLSGVTAIGVKNDLFKVSGGGYSGRDIRRQLKILAGRGRRHAELPSGNVSILLLNGIDDILRNKATLVQLSWIQPDPHAVLTNAEHDDVADTR